MYESFFQLGSRPFLASPSAERYYPAASIEHARETVARCIERSEGPAVILGSAGTGKSTVCEVLAHQMRDRFCVATLTCARLCTRRALLQNILFELKQPYRDREEGELRLSLIDFLSKSDACPNGMLLFVDEAHVLPLRLLEEIRMLTNLVRDGEPRVRFVLAASLVLDERLGSPKLESFNQRIAARCYLQSMSREETCGYVRAQIGAVGGDSDSVFAEDGLQAVYRATDGVPRLVNQVCDHVLMMAAIGGHAPIDAAGVEEAWADLQQLPAPWPAGESIREPSNDNSGVLEFGELDEPAFSELGPSDDSAAEPAPDVEPVEPQIAASLEDIELGVAAIVSDDVASTPAPGEDQQFQPESADQPEIELVFHQAHDPFSEPFADEEVIADPIGSLDIVGGSGESPQHTASSSTILFSTSEPAAESDQKARDPAELAAALQGEIRESMAECMSRAADSMSLLPGDDRDLLEVHDDADSPTPRYDNEDEKPLRRRAYRQLFANLRRK